MRILITGRGTSGSFQIRGVQLGAAIGATVAPQAGDAEIDAADVVVLVKRASPGLVDRIRRARKPLVWDVVDAWAQPEQNAMTAAQARAWITNEAQRMGAVAIVAATEAMAADVSGLPVLTLPHHARPGQALNPIRDTVQTVGYEGREAYLDHWRPWLLETCERRGWRFVTNPKHMSDVDIGVALRGGIWDGYAPRQWKSNVKLANFQATGTPCVLAPEAGYIETASGGEYFVRDRNELERAFDWLTDVDARRNVSERLRTKTLTLESVAKTYRDWLCALKS